jgi:hypothetical protein
MRLDHDIGIDHKAPMEPSITKMKEEKDNDTSGTTGSHWT